MTRRSRGGLLSWPSPGTILVFLLRGLSAAAALPGYRHAAGSSKRTVSALALERESSSLAARRQVLVTPVVLAFFARSGSPQYRSPAMLARALLCLFVLVATTSCQLEDR